MSEKCRAHPDCRYASNPRHECSEFCFKVIAEANKDTGLQTVDNHVQTKTAGVPVKEEIVNANELDMTKGYMLDTQEAKRKKLDKELAAAGWDDVPPGFPPKCLNGASVRSENPTRKKTGLYRIHEERLHCHMEQQHMTVKYTRPRSARKRLRAESYVSPLSLAMEARIASHKSPQPKKSVRHRSSIVAVVAELQRLKLRQEHMELLKRTPFWHIIDSVLKREVDISHCNRTDKYITEIINCYDKENGEFVFGRHRIMPKEDNVRLIFGIRDGGIEIKLRRTRKYSNFVRRCFPSAERLSKPVISEKLEETLLKAADTDVQDVARLITLYILVTMLVPSRNTKITWAYANLVENLDEICTYNWSKNILDTLVSSLNRNKDGHCGCALLLPYWLCEHTFIIQPVKEDLFPRFLKWDLRELQRSMWKMKTQNLIGLYLSPLQYSDMEKALLQHSEPQPLQATTHEGIDTRKGSHVFSAESRMPEEMMPCVVRDPQNQKEQSNSQKHKQFGEQGSENVVPLSRHECLSDLPNLSFVPNILQHVENAPRYTAQNQSATYAGSISPKINADLARTIKAITDKHGDITKECLLESDCLKTGVLFGVSMMLHDLQNKKLRDIDISTLDAYYTAVKDAQNIKINVQWLHQRLDEIKDAVKSADALKNLTLEKQRRKVAKETKMKELEVRKTELDRLRCEIQEIEDQLAGESVVMEELNKKIEGETSKYMQFQDMSLLDGLL